MHDQSLHDNPQGLSFQYPTHKLPATLSRRMHRGWNGSAFNQCRVGYTAMEILRCISSWVTIDLLGLGFTRLSTCFTLASTPIFYLLSTFEIQYLQPPCTSNPQAVLTISVA